MASDHPPPPPRPKRTGLAVLALAALVAVPGAAWLQAKRAPAEGAVLLEIRWHGNGIVLQGTVRDAATQQALVAGAIARLGGESTQLVDWLDIEPAAPPLADAAALAELIRLGQEGWHLQWREAGGWLAVASPGDARSIEAGRLLQRGLGPGRPVRIVAPS